MIYGSILRIPMTLLLSLSGGGAERGMKIEEEREYKRVKSEALRVLGNRRKRKMHKEGGVYA